MNKTWENGEKPNSGPNFGPSSPNDPIFRKFSDERIDGQTEESDFIGRYPTNVERPT